MKVCGIIIKVPYECMGDSSQIEILGKSMLDWVSVAFGRAPYKSVAYDSSVPLPDLIRPYIDEDSEYTVVLYSDTPLITKKTVADALEVTASSGRNVLKMTRGYVFKTEYILTAPKIYTESTYYFDEEDFVTAFNFKQVGLISDILKNRILNYHMERGVHFEDLATTFVGCDVSMGRGVVVGPNNVLRGNTIIKDNVRLQPNNVIEDCVIDEGAEVDSSHLKRSYVGKRTTVGPYANLREDNVVGEDCRIGDFVELKKCRIGDGSKLSHLTYAGNLDLGKDCNVGAGVVFANYDGKNKHTTKVGDRVFIGSSATIVAPCIIEDGAFIAAGSTITDAVEAGDLAIARARQRNIKGWPNNKYDPHRD